MALEEPLPCNECICFPICASKISETGYLIYGIIGKCILLKRYLKATRVGSYYLESYFMNISEYDLINRLDKVIEKYQIKEPVFQGRIS